MGRAIATMTASLLVGLLPGAGLGLLSDPDDGANIGAGLLIMVGLFLGPAVGGWLLVQRDLSLRHTILAAVVATPIAVALVAAIFAFHSQGDFVGGLVETIGGFLIVNLMWGVIIVGGAASGASVAERRRRPVAR